MEQAYVVLYLYDVRDPVGVVVAVREELVKKGKAFLLVGNKVDVGVGEIAGIEVGGIGVAGAGTAGAVLNAVQVRFAEEVLISARDCRGINVLKQRLGDLVLQGGGGWGWDDRNECSAF